MKYGNNKLLKIINRFKGKEILVVGDLMLDRYVKGNVSISPEAPVPVSKYNSRRNPPEDRIGGAANVANNISSLGGKVYLCGIVGIDRDGDIFVNEANKNNINCDGMLRDEDRQTTLKTRYISGHKDQQVFRGDDETTDDIPRNLENKIIDYI